MGRTPINVRFGERGLQFLDEIAAETHSDRSKVLRAALVLCARYRKELIALLKEQP